MPISLTKLIKRPMKSSTTLDSDCRNWAVKDDPTSGRVFYYNEVLDKSVWEKPECLKTSIEKIPIKPWTEYVAANKRTYYYNSETEETTWTIPPEVVLKREEYIRKNKANTVTDNNSSLDNSISSVASSSTASTIILRKTNKSTSSPEKRTNTNIKNILANGFGDSYKWVTLKEALHLTKIDSRPILLIIHKSWCRACKYLAPIFAESRSILELSEQFYLVNACDDDEPKSDDNKFAPDGKYNPRLLFYDSEGNLMGDIMSEDNKTGPFKYYHTTENSIVQAMKQCLKKFKEH